MNKLQNGKISHLPLPGMEDWAAIRFDKILKVDWVREEFNPKQPIKYLKETIRKCECGPSDIWFVTILRNNNPDHPVEIPLDLLCLTAQQKSELVLHRLVPKGYFKEDFDHLQGYYLKDDECFQPVEEEEDDDY